MSISRMCLECVGVVTGHCDGKDANEVKPEQKPCREYVFDMSMASEQDIEPDSLPPSLKDCKPDKVKPLVPDAVLPTNKVKVDAFKRLATKRLAAVLDGIRKLSNLSAKASYEWDAAQTRVICDQLLMAVYALEKKLKK